VLHYLKEQQGAKAEAPDKVKAAIKSDWLGDSAAVSFSFRGNHHYLWTKKAP
jgi:hypothetical protein